MPPSKPASLTGALISRKGEATPARPVSVTPPLVAPTAEPPLPVSPAVPPPVEAKEPEPSRAQTGSVAVTLRLDPARYRALKLHGVERRQTNQDILVAALDAYLATFTGTGGK